MKFLKPLFLIFAELVFTFSLNSAGAKAKPSVDLSALQLKVRIFESLECPYCLKVNGWLKELGLERPSSTGPSIQTNNGFMKISLRQVPYEVKPQKISIPAIEASKPLHFSFESYQIPYQIEWVDVDRAGLLDLVQMGLTQPAVPQVHFLFVEERFLDTDPKKFIPSSVTNATQFQKWIFTQLRNWVHDHKDVLFPPAQSTFQLKPQSSSTISLIGAASGPADNPIATSQGIDELKNLIGQLFNNQNFSLFTLYGDAGCWLCRTRILGDSLNVRGEKESGPSKAQASFTVKNIAGLISASQKADNHLLLFTGPGADEKGVHTWAPFEEEISRFSPESLRILQILYGGQNVVLSETCSPQALDQQGSVCGFYGSRMDSDNFRCQLIGNPTGQGYLKEFFTAASQTSSDSNNDKKVSFREAHQFAMKHLFEKSEKQVPFTSLDLLVDQYWERASEGSVVIVEADSLKKLSEKVTSPYEKKILEDYLSYQRHDSLTLTPVSTWVETSGLFHYVVTKPVYGHLQFERALDPQYADAAEAFEYFLSKAKVTTELWPTNWDPPKKLQEWLDKVYAIQRGKIEPHWDQIKKLTHLSIDMESDEVALCEACGSSQNTLLIDAWKYRMGAPLPESDLHLHIAARQVVRRYVALEDELGLALVGGSKLNKIRQCEEQGVREFIEGPAPQQDQQLN